MLRNPLPIALGLVSLALLLLALRPDRLVVEHVVFEGASRAGEGELRHLADVRNGTTMWAVDPGRVAQGVERHPWVRSARAHRRWPNTLVVGVEEREVALLLAYGGELYLVDTEGAVFDRAPADDLDHPVLTGVDKELERSHPRLPVLVVRDAVWLLGELDGRGLLGADRVSEIGFHPTHGFTVRLRGGSAARPAAEVLVGLGEYERQLARLAVLVDREAVDLQQPLHVDLAPERVAIVRPVDALVAAQDGAFLAP